MDPWHYRPIQVPVSVFWEVRGFCVWYLLLGGFVFWRIFLKNYSFFIFPCFGFFWIYSFCQFSTFFLAFLFMFLGCLCGYCTPWRPIFSFSFFKMFFFGRGFFPFSFSRFFFGLRFFSFFVFFSRFCTFVQVKGNARHGRSRHPPKFSIL